MKKVFLDDYNNEKKLLDLEYDFIEKLSKIRKKVYHRENYVK